MAALQQRIEDEEEEGAQRIRDRFLNEYSNSEEIDSRDVQRVRNCLSYVNKFLMQKMGDEEAAYDMMVNALKWRLTFGVNSLRYSDLEDTLIDIGLAYHHGTDRDNNTLVILNCHLHKKDPKKLPEIEKFFVFALESHARKYPDKKVTLVFNMSQCGLSNMDLEFVKIIINCFKFYFPNMLGYLLVFEMPWLLQAAWKIIKSWLSEVAVRKIKFVTKSDITDYISPDQLLTTFGGDDHWQYNPAAYRDELLKENDSIWGQDPLGISPTVEEYTREEEEEENKTESERQVRFAPGQPPSNQSRFGHDEDTDYYNVRNTTSLEPQLLRGTAASPGYRRRQVNRLIAHQQVPSAMQSSNSIDYGELPTQSLRRLPKYVIISPSDELLFCGQTEQDLFCTITLTNNSEVTIAYKIKTTAPKRYKVRPNINTIDPQCTANVQVQLVLTGGGSNIETTIVQDKFLIQTYQFEQGTVALDPTQLINLWKSLSTYNIHEHRLKCRYTTDPVEVSLINTNNSSSSNSSDIVRGGDQVKKDIPQNVTLIRKLDRMSNELNELRQTIKYVKYIVMVTLLLILFILCVLLVK